MAQGKRSGLINRWSVDRNHPPLSTTFIFLPEIKSEFRKKNGEKSGEKGGCDLLSFFVWGDFEDCLFLLVRI